MKAIDKEYSNNAFKVITNALCPDKIIFVSKKSFDALSIENKKTYKEKIFYCVHPNSFWWHKTMKKYGNKKGKEIFTNQTLGNPNFDFDNSVVVANNDDLKVFSNIENIESIVIYDLLGRTIFTKENINAKQFVVPVEKVHAPLIMKIKLANGIVVERKTIF